MRTISGMAVALILFMVLAFASWLGSPTAPLQNGATATDTVTATLTSTVGIRFPIVLLQPSPTPTSTPTPTPTPTPTNTSVPGATGLTGSIAFTQDKPSYATYIENVWFYESIHNPTSNTIHFGILGARVTGAAELPFKTSWDGAGTGGYLQIYAGCWGPAGIPCAGSADSGRHVDHVGDDQWTHSQWEITVPGDYQVELYVCYSSFSACQQHGGAWQKLGNSIYFTAVHWTPAAPLSVTATPEADKGEACYLITDDPRGIYLSCPESSPPLQRQVSPRRR